MLFFSSQRTSFFLHLSSFSCYLMPCNRLVSVEWIPSKPFKIAVTGAETDGQNNQGNFFFYLGFLSRIFTIHGTAREGGGYLFNSSLPLPPVSRHLHISRTISAESSSLHIASSRDRTGNFWFPSASRKSLSYPPLILRALDYQDYLVDSSKSLDFLLPDSGGLKVSHLFVSINILLWIIQPQ